jgi:hypothetical protein
MMGTWRLEWVVEKYYGGCKDLFQPGWQISQQDVNRACYKRVEILKWYFLVDPGMPSPSGAALRNLEEMKSFCDV